LVGIIGLVYAVTVQLPQLQELKKQDEIAKQDLIVAAKEADQANQNLISTMPGGCTSPSPACLKVMEFIKLLCDRPAAKNPVAEQYLSSCKEAERYLSLHQ
jgi:ribonuclease D